MSSQRVSPWVGLSPGESFVLGVLVVAVGVGAVVWTGATAAAAVVGGPPPGGLIDALRVLPRLMSRPGGPEAGWRDVTGRDVALAGAVAYWVCTSVAAVLAVGLLMVLRALMGRLFPARRRLGVDAHARFATRRELRPLLVRRSLPGRFVLGRWGGWLVATENQRWSPAPRRGLCGVAAWVSGRRRPGRSGDVSSVAIVGPTRSGKTAECAIPGVLDWVGPAILLSVKRDLMDTTIARRRELGAVRVFDPGGFLAMNVSPDVQVEPEELARWSPLRNAHTATGAKRAGEAMAAWTPQAGVEEGMSFWTSQGKILFTGLLGAAALTPRRSMRKVAEWVFNMTMPGDDAECEPAAILDGALRRPESREAAEAAVMHLAAIWNKTDSKLKSSVYSTAVTVCEPWMDTNVLAATDLAADGSGEWVDLDWLMDTGRDGDRANTLYLLVSQDDYKRLAPVLAGLLSDLKAQAYEWEMRGRRLPAPLLMMIDEAGNMPLDWLPEVSSTCAGLGIQLVTIWQSLAQIHQSYGRRADILLTNHATKLFFPAASDESTLSYQSKIVGDEEIERTSWSTDVAGGSGRQSISGQDSREALVPYFLARLPRFGQSLMIHSNTPPTQVSGRPWYRDRHLAAMVPSARGRGRGRSARRTAAALARRGLRPGTWEPTRRSNDNEVAVGSATDAASGVRVDRRTGEIIDRLTREEHHHAR